MTMTNDELNAWYDKEVLGNCPHELKWRLPTQTHRNLGPLISEGWECTKCDASVSESKVYQQRYLIPDHLSDPAVFREAIKILSKHHGDIVIEYHQHDDSYSVQWGVHGWASSNTIDAAAMLALKAKHESGGLENE